ncbi:hypothetical protein ACFE04_003697 [Oxalis oulophora]
MSAPSIYVILLFVIFIACYAEERRVYLVLMEETAVAFHRQPHEDGRKPDLKSEPSKAIGRTLVNSHDQFLQSTLASGSYKKLYSFKNIVNGFAIHTSPSQVFILSFYQAKRLKYSAKVKMVEKDRGAKLMTTYTPEFLNLPEKVWPQLGGDKNAGEGIVIGFVDTGINPLHPSFAYNPLIPLTSNLSHFSGACDAGPRFPSCSCNGKIVSARYFSAGAQAAATLNSSVDFLSPFDAVGHGSHVASIAAGNEGVPVVVNDFCYGRASGMAPRARIAVYKAIYPTMGTMADVVAAIDQAVEDGVDVLTLSVGPDEPPEDTLTVLGVFDIFMLFARKAGVFVVQAAGNQGPQPSTVVAYSPWAVSAAACSTDRTYPSSLLLGSGQRVGGVGLSGPTFGGGILKYKLVLATDALRLNDTFSPPQYIEECQYPEAFDPMIVRGSIVICTFAAGFSNGNSTLNAITDTARALRFAGFIFVANPAYGDFLAEPVPFTVPAIMIPKVDDAKIILSYYEQHTQRSFVTRFHARASIQDGRVAAFTGQPPVVSRFSSRGPDFIDANRNLLDVLKPDILAPGHQIWAAWSPVSALDPVFSGYDFALLSGTSMATPHIAGIAALIKQDKLSWTPSMIASAISTTAIKYDSDGELIQAEGSDGLYPATNFDFGTGLVNPSGALDPGLVLLSGFEDYIGFLCSLPGVDRNAIKTATGAICNHSLTHPANLNLPSVTISALNGSLTVRRSFTNVGNKPETYSCSVIPPNGTRVNMHPSWFRIDREGTQDLDIQFNATQVLKEFSFGEIILTGSLNHIVRIPLSVNIRVINKT